MIALSIILFVVGIILGYSITEVIDQEKSYREMKKRLNVISCNFEK